MNVLGLDPSLTMTGAVKIIRGGEIHAARFPTKSRTADKSDLPVLKHSRNRLAFIVASVRDFAPWDAFVVIEYPSLGSRGATGSFIERAGLFWMLVDELMKVSQVVAVTPKCRAKYATGNGNAGKPEVLAAMRAKFPQLDIPDDNVADALALALMGSRILGNPLDGEISTAQRNAMKAPIWPELRA